ncbi:Origin of replication complex subunit [Sesamum angolense]|uniref:Origin of replication complex subunit n=1 Tax=Sesamum angolense TaxID=2727404 RepID=A0AAE2C711_9LAMI|nr:Origin of replication complex subunit [Sesamum angolense]
MSDILLQVSSLCSANFITKGGSCPLEGSTRYRSTISEDMALKIARSLKFPLSKYLYRRKIMIIRRLTLVLQLRTNLALKTVKHSISLVMYTILLGFGRKIQEARDKD